jgi:beta-lactamase regulating signal transducer with metallopeptidase domain
MMSVQQILSSDCVHRCGWMLLHSLWQLAIAGVLTILLLRILRRRTANTRYVVACIGLASMFLAPLTTYFLIPKAAGPEIALHSTPHNNTAETPVAVGPLVFDAGGEVDQPVAEAPAAVRPLVSDAGGEADEQAANTVSPTRVSPAPETTRLLDRATSLLAPCVPWTVLLWAMGVIGLSVWHLGGYIAVRRLSRFGVVPVPESLERRFRELKARLRVTQPVRLLQSILVEVPVAVGWLRPVILAPATVLTGLAPEAIEAVLAHELAHIRRYDYLVNLAQTVVETLLFFHPAVWWVSRRIRIEREHCCDDVAIAACGSKVAYAQALTVLEEGRRSPELAMAATGGKTAGTTLSRIRRILGVSSPDCGRASVWLGGIITLALLASLAVVMPLGHAEGEQKPDSPATNDAAKRPDAEKSALLVSLVPTKTEFAYGEPVMVRFDVKNVSKEPVGLWSRDFCSWGHEVYHFEITMPDGSIVKAEEPQIGWNRNSPHTRELAPGKTFSVEFDLMRLTAGPLPPGEYQVRGIYRSAGLDAKEPDWVKKHVAGLWIGETAADPIKIVLKPTWKSKELVVPRVVWLTTDARSNAAADALMIACPAASDFKADDLVCLFQHTTTELTNQPSPPKIPLAIAKIRKVYPQSAMVFAEIKPDTRFDEVRIGDTAENGTAGDARLNYAWTLAAAQPANTATEKKVRMDYGPMRFLAVHERDDAKNICTLHVDRIGSRFTEEKNRHLLWQSWFASRPDSIEFKDGLLVARNRYHTWWIRPLSGRDEKMESHGNEPLLKNPAMPASPSAAKSNGSAWGEAVEGVSVRLRADRTTWSIHETPNFTLDFRNQGPHSFRFLQSPVAGTFEVDGIEHGRASGWGGGASSPFIPGQKFEGLRVSLDEGWQAKLKPGKHTIRYATPNVIELGAPLEKTVRTKDTPNYVAVTCKSNPVEIEILNSDAKAAPVSVPWGTPVEGVAASLQADHFAWTSDDQPTFKMSVRNQGQRNDLFFTPSQALGELEVDGILYHPTWPIRRPVEALPPGRQYNGIFVTLTSEWRTKDNKPFQLACGRHIVRFIVTAEPSQKLGRASPIHAPSNPVEINVEPGVAKLAALVKKHLPGCVLRAVRKNTAAQETMEEVLTTPAGKEINLAAARRGWRGAITSLPPVNSSRDLIAEEIYLWRNPTLTALAPSLELKIATPAAAEDIVRIILGLFKGPELLDHWIVKAEPMEDGWLVTPTYAGPPAQVRWQGPVELIVKDGVLKDVRERGSMSAHQTNESHPAGNAAEPGWSEPVDGLAVRLQSDKPVWYLGGNWPALRLSVRNVGTETLAVPESQELGELELDGVWYTFSYPQSKPYYVARKPLASGRQVDNIAVLPIGNWSKDGKRIPTVEGKHTLRFAVSAIRRGANPGPAIRAVSNPVEVEFRWGVSPRPSGASGSGKGGSAETKPPDKRTASEWQPLGKTQWASIDVEKSLCEKAGEPGFFIHVRVKNLTNRPIGVDLRGQRQWTAVYPKMWGEIDTEHRGIIRERRIIHKALDESARAKLLADFAAGQLAIIPVGKSIDYYREFISSSRADVDKARRRYLFVSLDGEQLLADGKNVEQFSLEWRGDPNNPAADLVDHTRTDLIIPTPSPWKTMPSNGQIVPQEDSRPSIL